MKYIYHHLGLGDHIICNGIVRYLLESEDELFLFCKHHNYKNVSYMYRDDTRIKILSIGEDIDVIRFIQNNKIENNLIKIGFENVVLQKTTSFDEAFYKQINIPFFFRFQKFFFKRNIEKEKEIYESLNPNNEKYIFTHSINRNLIRNDLKIIENPTEYSLFDLIFLIENAEEVHLMESSLKCLVNSYNMKKPKFFYHQYVRGYSSYLNTKGLNKFNIIY